MTFEPSKLQEHVQAIATLQGRAVDTDGHRRARRYLCDVLDRYRLQPYSGSSYEMRYGKSDQDFVNVIASTPGSDPSRKPILLAAHYDTCGMLPGADDNAAAVAILLELGQRLIIEPAECSIILAFFDAEEPPYFLQPAMGSIRFYEDQKTSDVSGAIVLDLVGHDVPVAGLEDILFITGMESSSSWAPLLQACEPQDIRLATVSNSYIGSLSDYHIFQQNGDPFLFLSCGRWIHYHGPTDTPDRLNYEKIAATANFVEKITRQASRLGISRMPSSNPLDPELHFLRKNLLPTLQKMNVLEHLNSRKDIDHLVARMAMLFC